MVLSMESMGAGGYSTRPLHPEETMKIILLRGVGLPGRNGAKGETVDVSRSLARELIDRRIAKIAPPEEPPKKKTAKKKAAQKSEPEGK